MKALNNLLSLNISNLAFYGVLRGCVCSSTAPLTSHEFFLYLPNKAAIKQLGHLPFLLASSFPIFSDIHKLWDITDQYYIEPYIDISFFCPQWKHIKLSSQFSAASAESKAGHLRYY